MARVKSPRRARHKKVLKLAKGYRESRHSRYKVAREAVIHAGQYAYVGRKQRKRNFRTLWIQRLNAAVREEGMTYNKFIHALKTANINLDRKTLADMAVNDPETFNKIVERVKSA